VAHTDFSFSFSLSFFSSCFRFSCDFLLHTKTFMAYCAHDGCARNASRSRHTGFRLTESSDRRAQHEQLLSKDEQILRQDEQLVSRDEEIERLKLLIAKLRRMQFGRRSEKLDWQIEQLELRLDELEASRAGKMASTSATPAAAPVVNQTAKPARRPLPTHLPRETRKVLPKQEACPDCGGKLKQLGEDVSETLEYVPEHFKAIRQVRPKLACACCDKIVQAEAASRPIARGIAGPGLLAHVLVSKCGPLAVVSSGGDLRTRRSGAGSLDHGGVGRGLQPVTGAIGGGVAASGDARREAARR
jgi:transposase IS66-like protein/transposase IS166 family protein